MIELPKDAEGREIPLDTGTLYGENGIAKYIYRYEFDPRDKYWVAETDDGPRNTSEFLLNRPDSWEKNIASSVGQRIKEESTADD